MNEEKLLDTILDSTYVKADVLRRTRLVREYLEQRFFTPGDKKDLKGFLAEAKANEEDAKAFSSWGNGFFETFTKENAYEELEAVNALVKKLPVINLYVPCELDGVALVKLGTWVRENVERRVLIELHVDVSTIGGCTLAWNGVHYDYSLSHSLRKHADDVRKIISDHAHATP